MQNSIWSSIEARTAGYPFDRQGSRNGLRKRGRPPKEADVPEPVPGVVV
ncbi:MAG: hypothetical protein IJL62_06940 [Clostridia bacterium]|nr:hypothetical protein [Clostridia bacterium]